MISQWHEPNIIFINIINNNILNNNYPTSFRKKSVIISHNISKFTRLS